MFKVESGVPVEKMNAQYPFGKMQVGDSFLYPGCSISDRNRINSASQNYGKRHGIKFTIKREGNSLRVWRIL